MKTFKDLLEAPQTIVFAFGRFNPPTTGHEKLINKVKSVAGNVPYRIYPSFTTNPKKDPLPHALKVAYMRKMFPKHRRNIIADKNAKTAIMIAEMLFEEGYKNLVMVAGSDRVKEFSDLLNRYNDAPDKKGNQLFKFDSVQVISAGERDPDAEGVEGMSASKMRAAAANGDKDAFLTGLPKGFKDGVKLYRDVRKYMGIREERDMGDMTDFETVRDMFLTGKIWNAGDIVEANGVTGEVVRKGTNYLSFVDEDGKVHKAWLHEIELDEIRSSRPRAGGSKSIEQSVKIHVKLMKQYMDKGMDKDKASKKAMSDVMNMKPAERKKFLAKEEVQPIDERNYRKEYDNYQGRPEQIARRSSRNKARRIMGDRTKIGMDVGHKDNNPMNNSPENLRNEDPSINRREPRLREAEDHRKDYETFAKMYTQLNKAIDDASAELKKFKGGPMGLTPDKVKISPKFKKAKADYEKASNLTKRFLKGVPKDFLKKYSQSRRLRREEVEFDEDLTTVFPWLGKLKDKLFDKTHGTELDKLSFEYAKRAAKEYKKDKRINPMQIVHDVSKIYRGVSDRLLKKHINDLVDKGMIPKELKAEYEPQNETMSFKDFVSQIQINEKLSKDADAGEYIKDFEKSDAPQFKGKSKEERKKMAIAAYLDNKRNK